MPTNWPALPVAEWAPTRDTLQLWMQIVGKTRMVHTPLINHWWNVPLYVTARGCTTSLIPNEDGRGFELNFDFLDHTLDVNVSDGSRGSIALEPMTVARFYRSFTEMLDKLGLHTEIWPVPVEIPDAHTSFADDETHHDYDARRVTDFWHALVQMDRVLHEFRARFIGKASPVHLFWGGLDLAVTRFSGRTAPPWPGHAPNCGPEVMFEAYSHEVSSCGYWPGPDGEGNFYAYAYPEPDGLRTSRVAPAEAHYDEALGEFLLPYEAVRTAPDPDATLLEFLQSTYEATANAGGWDRAALER
jgi:Family of unknown function (DUF5996)